MWPCTINIDLGITIPTTVMLKMVMFSSFNFSWNLSSDIRLEHLAETLEDKFQLKLKEENITIFIVCRFN